MSDVGKFGKLTGNDARRIVREEYEIPRCAKCGLARHKRSCESAAETLGLCKAMAAKGIEKTATDTYMIKEHELSQLCDCAKCVAELNRINEALRLAMIYQPRDGQSAAETADPYVLSLRRLSGEK